ncbi:uncharacterized protein EI97DRAFT_405577 [Westerdykella ornata]|uniref:Uncharacterized protein n=1 Tax=Westerdykella ornata TaxID=318751 RepID=A0A6A6J958_WESOR|nr:uncharacterized protein EI97DRAFT_405577 [Westerdykella ornata]KAF2272713.1 hypothetical protein EI97DRAFT_405577 [Westerdykella ornata]
MAGTDSPAPRIPLDPKEQPILDKLLAVRGSLELLKQDRGNYVKSEDVIRCYDQVIEQVEILNNMRTEKRLEQNRVDYVLDDCLQLISLAFMTVGRTHEAPALYAFVSTAKRLLDHLKEAMFYSNKDLESIKLNLSICRQYIERGRETHSPHLLTLLEARIQLCEQRLAELQLNLSHLTDDLRPEYEKLVSILRTLCACNTRSKFPHEEVDDFLEQLKELQEKLRAHGIKAFESDGTKEDKLAEMAAKLRLAIEHPEPEPEADKLIETLLQRCFVWISIMKKKEGRIAPNFKKTYDKLLNIRNQLQKLSLTQAWSMRETDLWGYQRQLDRIDEARVDGNFVDELGRPAELYEQRTLLYLLRKSYALIYQLLLASEPVSEALKPIYNQLSTLKRCLTEVKNLGGVSHPRELWPYSMKLTSIDDMRVDGKFMIGNDIPEGQGSVIQLLEECFQLVYDLRMEAEERAAEERGNSSGSESDAKVELKKDDLGSAASEASETSDERQTV